ncbi:MAG: penicillin-binding protein [bacterium]
MKKPKHALKINYQKVAISFFALLFTAVFGVVIHKLLEVQVLNRGFYLNKLNRQYEKTFANTGIMRGDIYDRNGVELASSIVAFSLYVNKEKIENINDFVKDLSALTKTPATEIRKAIENSKSNWFFLSRKLEDERLKRDLMELKKKPQYKNCIEIVEESKRFYPYKELASHILGFVNEDNEGLEGIEYFYDKSIKGDFKKASTSEDFTEGIMRRGKFIKEGNSIELTIDKDIQAIADDELKKGVLKARAKSGFVIVASPETGEILAMSSYPNYDPNNYSSYSANERRNRAVLDLYEPGSVFKVFVIAAALDERAIGPSTVVFCENGRYKVHDRVFKEAHMKRYGMLSVRDVIKYSSNIGSAKIAEKLGKKRLYEYLIDFGFGKKTGLGFSGESKGIVPGLKELTPVRFTTVAFGQGISINPVQTTMAFCAVVNGGNLLKPILVRKVLDEQNNVIYENQKEIIKRVIKPKTSEIMKDLLRDVVTEGTGKDAEITGAEVIGKTGTAQKAGKRGYTNDYFASFIGAFPREKPKYVIYVGVDTPQGIVYGGYVAGPIFREIGRRIIDLKGEERKVVVLNSLQSNTPQQTEIKYRNITSFNRNSDNNVDFRGLALREVIKVANLKKIRLEIVGSGTVYHQEPVFSGNGEKRIKVYLQ